MTKALTGGLAALLALTLTSTAFADVERSTYGKDGDVHVFKDDPLAAGVSMANGEIIKIRPHAARTTLIRPRTSFVPEMLKSVENM